MDNTVITSINFDRTEIDTTVGFPVILDLRFYPPIATEASDITYTIKDFYGDKSDDISIERLSDARIKVNPLNPGEANIEAHLNIHDLEYITDEMDFTDTCTIYVESPKEYSNTQTVCNMEFTLKSEEGSLPNNITTMISPLGEISGISTSEYISDIMGKETYFGLILKLDFLTYNEKIDPLKETEVFIDFKDSLVANLIEKYPEARVRIYKLNEEEFKQVNSAMLEDGKFNFIINESGYFMFLLEK